MPAGGLRRTLATLLGAAALGGLVLAGAAGTAGAATPTPTASASPSASASVSPSAGAASNTGGVWFGPELDWGSDGPTGYRDRLGQTPALYQQRFPYPLDTAAIQRWQSAAVSAAAQGAVLVASLEPTGPLAQLTAADATALNSQLQSMHDQYGTLQLVQFAAEMNGSWTAWGQQPTEYVGAFQTVASAVHAGTSGAQMVWTPSYGAGYPFATADGKLANVTPTDLAALDTNHDGKVTTADDPYGPYWPGRASVDRVGLTMYYFGKGAAGAAAGSTVPLDQNNAPAPNEVSARLAESWGYTAAQPASFYARYADGQNLPMMLDTGALYDPSKGGATDLAVKQGWWRQLLAALPSHPRIDVVSWLEAQRVEAEAGGQKVDWRATADPTIAAALNADLTASGLIRPGPITAVLTQQQANAATVQLRSDGTTPNEEIVWITWCAVALALAYLLSGVVGRALPSWRYVDDSGSRDLRIDLVRGFIIIVVVVTHIEVTSPFGFAAHKAIGAITGAELFVLLSGLVLGMVYPLGVKKAGEWRAALAAWGRARKQYLVTLVVILVIFALGFVPFIDTTAITTFTDRGTGAGGAADIGRVYSLYPNADRLLDYPPPWYAIRQFLLLEMGPWPFNIMGLFVVLSLTIPALMWLIRRRMWWVVLLVSWALYTVQYLFPDFQPISSQFNAVFPLLIWQVLFTHGLVLGYYRARVIRALTTMPGRIAIGVLLVGYAGFLAYLWAGQTYGFTPTPFPADLYARLYDSGFPRIDLAWGRLIDLVVVMTATYAVLTTMWKPIARTSAWLWVPLGQASMYVFIVHVFFVLAVANIPGLDRMSWWQGTLIHVVVVGLIYLMVRKKFLFKVIPR